MKTHLQVIKIILCALTLGASVTAQAMLPPPNSGMGTITNGWFYMGDYNDGNPNSDAAKHQVFVNAFQMDTNLITYANWQLVYQDAINHGYSFNTNAGSGVANYPVQAVTWYDAVKWCNARSRMEGLTPCYYTDTNFLMVYTSGIVSLKSNNVNWAANGYRLPTEAEWEKAARGGLTTNRFPWGMYITHSNACYITAWANGNLYDLTPNAYANNPTSAKPVGSFKPPNGYGLYDMAGNVNEWCWDFYATTYYLSTPRPTNSPTGPVSGSTRVARGGQWNLFADSCRCAARFQFTPTGANPYVGFRCVRGKQSQTISFNPLPNHFYGDGPITLVATGGGSTSPVIFTNTGPATISGISSNVLTITGAGPVTVTANQAGDATYSAASPVSQSFTVNQATPLVNATGGTFTYNGTAKASSGTATGGAGESLAVALSYAGTGSTSYGPMASAPSAAGTYTVTASTAGDANNIAGSSSAVALTINKATPLVNATGGTFTYNGTAKASSGTATGGADETLAVSLSYAGTGSTSYGPTASAPHAAGTYTVTASTAGDANNTAGSSSAVALTINKASLSIMATNASKEYGQTLSFAGTEFTPTGLVGSDSVSSVTLTSTGATNTAPVANSPYIITPSSAIGSGLGNYNITYNPGYLTVSNAVLTVTHSGNSVIISWPSASTGFVLQQNSNLATTNWTTSSGISDDGTNKSITITSLTGNLFFRLSHP